MKTPREDLDRLYSLGINPRTRLLYLGSLHDNDFGNDAVSLEESGIYWNTARRLIMGLAALDEPNKPITVLMNSCGGDWDHGMAMYDAIANSRSHVTIINMSHARSMTSVIFQAADLRITAPHSFYMIHDGFEGSWDIPKSVYNQVEFSRQHVTPRMYRIYLDRLQEHDEAGAPKVDIKEAADILNAKLPEGAVRINKSRGIMGIKLTHISQLCSRDTFFTPSEMVKLNFADRLLEPGDLVGAYANPKMHNLPTGLDSLDGEE